MAVPHPKSSTYSTRPAMEGSTSILTFPEVRLSHGGTRPSLPHGHPYSREGKAVPWHDSHVQCTWPCPC